MRTPLFSLPVLWQFVRLFSYIILVLLTFLLKTFCVCVRFCFLFVFLLFFLCVSFWLLYFLGGAEPAGCTSHYFLSSPVPPCPRIHFVPQCLSRFIVHDAAAHSQGTSCPKPSSPRWSVHAMATTRRADRYVLDLICSSAEICPASESDSDLTLQKSTGWERLRT